MTSHGRLLVIGGAHIDRRGRTAGPFVPGASNPGSMSEDVGGGAFNAARHATRRGVAAAMMSVRGGDQAGGVARAMGEAGIADLSAIFLDRPTPSYTAILDDRGEVVAALADMALYDVAFPRQLRRAKLRQSIAGADAILCDANLPSTALASLAAHAAGRLLFAIAISPAKAIRFSTVLPAVSVLFMNRREASALGGDDGGAGSPGVIGRLRTLGLRGGIISDGANPLLGFDAHGVFTMDPPVPRHIEDVTGAGDALAGATVAALMRGLALRAAVREGLAAALLTLESASPAPAYGEAEFARALSLVPHAEEMR